MSKKDATNRSDRIRWSFARILCFIHLGMSIYLLHVMPATRPLFFLPIIGLGFITIETLVSGFVKLRIQSAPFLLAVYSTVIITSIWLFELQRIKHLVGSGAKQPRTEVSPAVYDVPEPGTGSFFLRYKYLFSQIQIQAYLFVMVALRSLCQTKKGRLDTSFKMLASALEILDFIGLLDHPELYSNTHFVHITLTVWSISCIQFIIRLPTKHRIVMKYDHLRFICLITNSLLSMLLMDIPYLTIRLYAIFGCGKHDYTSYFLVFKNIVIIALQATNGWMVGNKNSPKKKKNSVCV